MIILSTLSDINFKTLLKKKFGFKENELLTLWASYDVRSFLIREYRAV